MICTLSENYKPQYLSNLFTELRNKYFSSDINKNIKTSVRFDTVDKPKLDIANLLVSETEIKNLQNNEQCNVTVIFNNDIEFNRDALIESMLHELIHIYQLSKNVNDFKSEKHTPLFQQKRKEIENKVNHPIRINMVPDDIISQNDLDKYIKTLNKSFKLIIIYKEQNNKKTIQSLALFPLNQDTLDLFNEYILFLRKNNKHVMSLDYKKTPEELHKQIKENVNNIFGSRNFDVYYNINNFYEQLVFNELKPVFTNRSQLSNDLITELERIINN